MVERLRAEGRIVAMAGDGINDASAPAAAHAGIAMATGTDVAMESAGVTLVKGDLHGIVRARRLSPATLRNIRQNLLFSFAYNTLGIPVAAGLVYPFFGLLLSPNRVLAPSTVVESFGVDSGRSMTSFIRMLLVATALLSSGVLQAAAAFGEDTCCSDEGGPTCPSLPPGVACACCPHQGAERVATPDLSPGALPGSTVAVAAPEPTIRAAAADIFHPPRA